MTAATEDIHQELRQEIITGVRRPGEQFHIPDLTAKYGVSKTKVREALNALKQTGLVETVPRVGYFVARITMSGVNHAFEVRMILECAAVERATERISEHELQHLERMTLGYKRGDLVGYAKFLQENKDFHYQIAVATGNPRLAQLVSGILDDMSRMLFVRLDLSEGIEGIVPEHRTLLDEMRRRDAAAARQIMVRDIENAHQALLQAILDGRTLAVGI